MNSDCCGQAQDSGEFSLIDLLSARNSPDAYDLLLKGCPDKRNHVRTRCNPFFGVHIEDKNLFSLRLPLLNSAFNITVSIAKGMGALPATSALFKIKQLEDLSGKSIDVAVMTAGLHYLHLWPALKFETADVSGIPLQYFSTEARKAVHAVRTYLGTKGLVIWKNTNDVCEVRQVQSYNIN